MKTGNFFRVFILLLLAFITTGGGYANSYNSFVPNLDPRNYDYLQEDQNTTAHLFEEISVGGSLEVTTKNNSGSGTGYIAGNEISTVNLSEVNKLTSLFNRNKKEVLKIYIFPFHLFW